MKKRQSLFMLIVAIIFSAVVFTSCSSGKKEAVQLMDTAYKTKDYNRMMFLADSLEKVGDFSAVKANYWRGYASDRLKQKDKAEQYWRASLKAGEESDDKDDLVIYAKSASRLANLLSVRGDYSETLELSIPVAERMEALKCDTTSDYINLLIYIGCCQAVIDKEVKETDHGFYRAYKKHLENIEKKHTDASYKDAIAGLINVAHYCVKAQKYEAGLYYTRYFGELLGEYELRPDVDGDYVDKQLGRYCIYKAQALDGLGKKEEAAEMFETFQDTEFSKTPAGLSLAEDYLVTIGQPTQE